MNPPHTSVTPKGLLTRPAGTSRLGIINRYGDTRRPPTGLYATEEAKTTDGDTRPMATSITRI
jgi:hypothetical protein